jgi:hypothetical protein
MSSLSDRRPRSTQLDISSGFEKKTGNRPSFVFTPGLRRVDLQVFQAMNKARRPIVNAEIPNTILSVLSIDNSRVKMRSEKAALC